MTIKALYPTVRPSLNLDFAKTKALDPRVTFTRASTGTFVGSNGLIQTAASGAARFDHNPETGESLGLLVEEARTNLVTYSEQFGGAGWGRNSVTITANSATAPDGTTTADTFAGNGTNSQHYMEGSGAAGAKTISVFAKANTNNFVQLFFSGGGSSWANFNVSTGVVGSIGTLCTASIQQFANGWYRCILATTDSGAAAPNFCIVTSATSGRAEGNSLSTSVYLWGAQSEASQSFPTSYIPTSGSTVTRAADVATLANTGSSIFPTSAFTTVNSPFGTAGGGTTVKLVGPTVKRTAVYNGDLTQTQINALAEVNDEFWRWRVLGSSFALPSFTTDGSVTVDWGDGVVETLTTAVHTFTNGGGYHDIGFRLNSGTFFKPVINDNATYKTRVIALGPAPASMKLDALNGFFGCSALKAFDGTVDTGGRTSFFHAWRTCASLTSFPLINTAAGTNFGAAWLGCSSLTSFPLINTAAGISFSNAWQGCTSLTSFPLINTAAGTNFNSAWFGCTGLTSFPLINTGAGTSFDGAWYSCSSLTSFPLINTAAGTSFLLTWYGCSSLTSLPLIDTGAGTNFQEAWRSCSSLTSFPLLNTAAGTNFNSAWNGCSSLTSFPLINTAAGTNFSNAWLGCSSLTSFPLINTAAGFGFPNAWRNCSSLTSFPLIDTAAGTNFSAAWYGCSSLTSFPLIDTAAGTNFSYAWRVCSSLTDFPANFFDSWTGTPVANCFLDAWDGCSALTATSVENILNSIDTSGQSAPASGVDITIDYNAGTGTPSVATAITNLQSRGWTITLNGVLQ